MLLLPHVAYMEHEARVLWGEMEYLLPQVGPHVRTLDLAHGKAVSNDVVRETQHTHVHPR